MTLRPFFNPSDQLTECLRDLAIACYTDVAVANGMLCSVGVTAQTYSGESWSAYSPTEQPCDERVNEADDDVCRLYVLQKINDLERQLRKSLVAPRTGTSIRDIVQLSVRLSYSTSQAGDHASVIADSELQKATCISSLEF